MSRRWAEVVAAFHFKSPFEDPFGELFHHPVRAQQFEASGFCLTQHIVNEHVELIGRHRCRLRCGPDINGWNDVDGLELASLTWVHWFNHNRLHGYCNDIPPVEYEAAFYAGQQTHPAGGRKPI